VALGFVLGIDPTIGITALCMVLALLVIVLERRRLLANDTLMGILAHSALALGMVAIALLESLRVDLLGYLFGDILAVSRGDLVLIFAITALVLILVVAIWRWLLSATVHTDLAAVEGVPTALVDVTLMLAVALAIAIGMKVVGILLIVAMLILPAAAARRLAQTPEQMALGAVLLGILSVVLGLGGSWEWDTPAGPSIVVAATALFAGIYLWPRRATEEGA
jgi:zinc transport system permease protein